MLAGGDRAGRLRDAPDARLPDAVATFYDMLETRARRPPPRLRLHEHLVLAARRRRAARRAARGGRRRSATSTCAASSASAPATSRRWPRSTASTSARCRSTRRAASSSARCAPARSRCPAKQLHPPRASADPEVSALDDRHPAVRAHRRAGPRDARGLRAPRRLLGAAQGARHDPRGGPDECSRPPACAGAAAPASRWARRPRSSRRARCRSTSSCNADESEPGTFKDRELMQKNPHQLIEGIVIAAYAADATKTFIYIRGEYEQQADMLDAAIAEAYEARLPRRATSSARASTARSSLHRGAGAYICGEETGLLDSLEGKRGNPRLKPPFPANQGLFQGPTLINNVETLSTRPAHRRASAPRSTRRSASKNSTGTKLVSVRGNVQRPGQLRDRARHSSREIIFGLAGGPPEGREVKLWFPGGSSSPVLTAGGPRPAVRLRRDGGGGLDARLRRDHRRRRLAVRSSTSPASSRSSTATSPAASARRAARARTGP